MAGHRVTIELDEETAELEAERAAVERGLREEAEGRTMSLAEFSDRIRILQGLWELDAGKCLGDAESRALLKRLAG